MTAEFVTWFLEIPTPLVAYQTRMQNRIHQY